MAFGLHKFSMGMISAPTGHPKLIESGHKGNTFHQISQIGYFIFVGI